MPSAVSRVSRFRGRAGRRRDGVGGRPFGWLDRHEGVEGFARFQQGAHQQVGVGGDGQVDGVASEGILGPAVAQRRVRRAGDDPPGGGMAVAGRGGQGPGQVGPVQAQDQVRGPDQSGGRGGQEDAGRVRVQRVRGREDRAVLEVGKHQRAVPFGQGDAAVPVVLVAAGPAEQEQRTARLAEEVQRGPDRFGVRTVRSRRPVPSDIGDGRRRGQALFLQAHVEADVNRRGRRRPGDRIGLGERVQRRLDRGGLVVPLDVRPDQRALVGGGVDPVDPGTPPGRVHRAGRPDDQHGHAVAPGVVDRHGRVHQADVAVQRDGHRPPGHLGVAVRDRDRVLLVQADEHPRIAVAVVVHQAVVQPAVARAGDQREVAQVEAAEEFGHRVAAPLDRDIADWFFGFFGPHAPRIARQGEASRAAGTATAARRGRCSEGGVTVHRPRA